MPAELVAATHFYNFGASNLEGPRNPLSILKAAAQPGDFVVFKLDIDTPSVEIPLVEALLSCRNAGIASKEQADAIGLVHGLDHVVDQAADSVIDLRHRLGNGVQTGVRILKNRK
jgi:hypothetical protein